MRRTWMLTAVAAVALTASPALGSEAQRHADPIGDAVGGAPDIVAVSFSQPDESRVSIGIGRPRWPIRW